MEAASLAALADGALFGADDEVRLRVITAGTEHKLADEAIQQVLQLGGIMWPVHDEPVVLEVKLSLGAQLTSKVLGRVYSTQITTDSFLNIDI